MGLIYGGGYTTRRFPNLTISYRIPDTDVWMFLSGSPEPGRDEISVRRYRTRRRVALREARILRKDIALMKFRVIQ